MAQRLDAPLDVLDLIEAHAALVDARGVITRVNAAWNRFALDNGGALPQTGVDYLEVCRRAGTPTAQAAGEGLTAVIAGAQARFELEYPCHAPSVRRWFRLVVRRLVAERDTATLVLHDDITEHVVTRCRLKLQLAAARCVEARCDTEHVSELVGALVAAVEWDAGLLWQTGDATALLGAVLPRAPALEAASKGGAPLPPGSHVPAQLEDPRAAAAARDGLRTALVIEVPAAAGGALAFELFSRETNLLEPRLVTELDAALRVVAAGMERARLARAADDLFEMSPDAQLIVSDGVIRRVSRAADGLLGYRAHELVGLSVETLVPEARRDAHRAQREAATASAHDRAMGEQRLQARGKDGGERTVEISLARSSLGLLAAVRDVTERVAVEARAERAERLEQLRRVSGGLAHHLNTPLQIATSNAEFLESALDELVERAKGERLAPPSPRRAQALFGQTAPAARDLLAALERMRQLVHALTLSAPAVEHLRRTDLAALAGEVAAQLDPRVPSGVELRVALEAAPWVEVDPDLLREALGHLLDNALVALAPRGGSVWLRVQSGRMCSVEVEDDGPGIEPALHARIFEPLWTTSPIDRAGMGLTIARAIFEGLGGSLQVQSEPGRGARFIGTLPPMLPPTG